MVTGGVCSMYFQHYIRVISLVQKGRDYSEEDQRHSDRGSKPQGKFKQGEQPQEENGPFPLMSKGER
jgi:hypothetical protein